MVTDTLTIKIAGPAGAGIKSSGLLLSHILIDHGFNTKDYSEYPSLIRGGHNTYQVSFSIQKIFAPHFLVDIFFSLIPNHWQQHQDEFTPKTLVFGDDGPIKLPLQLLADKLGNPIYKNTICLGVLCNLLGFDLKKCQAIITSHFKSDPQNLTAFNNGFDYATEFYKEYALKVTTSKPKNNQQIYDGNEAFGWGFIQGGGNFYASYPMTPATGTLHFLAAKQKSHHLTVIHPEDEIAAANICAGASFAGLRAATGTSGGGFALMNETVSFCAIAEIGLLFYLVSRPGPATGLPTWTSQGDLLYAVNSGHGEFVKVVLAPGDQLESFELSALALNIAAKYRLPVIVLSDKFIAESSSSLPDLSALKVKVVASTAPVPGTPGHEYLANSYEHDESGFSTEDAPLINKMVAKRLGKNSKVLSALPRPVLYGNKNAKKLIISWGSTKSTILEVLRLNQTLNYAYLHLKTLWPINPDINYLIKPFDQVIVVENNATSQLTTLLKSQFDFNPDKIILKFDGRPFFPEELIKKLI